MEDLIGLIIPLLAVAGWLFGMFKTDEEEQKGGKPTRPSRPTPTSSRHQPNNTDPAQSTVNVEVETQTSPATAVDPSRTQTYYEKKKAKLAETKPVTQRSDGEVFASHMDPIQDVERPRQLEKRSKDQAAKKEVQSNKKLSIRRNLSKKGIAESFVMAEVLGQPRAHRPYQRRRRAK
ncbi:hypothetical protein ERJ70_11525 [Sediminibacillus dalangtanensis]|uniref:Uncharacterized protein n=1 Tax=Sediminibacillus dalangtanensis TaxID=2729421 RepID=A0ABX7VZH5_9BACI|nr:hypothetical protein [Sediminibacillus dalangtanensis]QTM99867.1 hypothetical protein ERJ70_11525 [Sediminibacillus dalangtanensis]